MARIHFIYPDINTGSYPGVNHGLASLAAILRRDGHQVSLHHLTTPESPDAVVERAIEAEPDVVGFSFTTNQKQYIRQYSTAIDNRMQTLQIAGGVHPTIAPEDALHVGQIKGVCIGEGEHPLCELLRRMDKAEDFTPMPGFWWRGDGQIIRNAVPALDPDIDAMPSPDYSLFCTDRIGRAASGWVALMLTRGCPYNCYYCCNHVLRSIYPNTKDYVRIPGPQRAIEIIKHGLSYYRNVAGVNFADDLLIYKPKWFKEFAALYSSEIGLPYTCNGRIEHCTDQTLAALKESGCKTVYLGIESGNEWVRKNLLGRPHTNGQIVDCFRRIRKHGLSSFAYNIVGFPFETKAQMEETLSLNRAVKPTSGVVFYFYPYPATRLFAMCKEFNLLPEQETNLSSYLERPAIKLTHCTEADCVRLYNRFRLYLASLGLVSSLRMPAAFSRILYLLLNLNRRFWVRLITRNSALKHTLRRLFYRCRFG